MLNRRLFSAALGASALAPAAFGQANWPDRPVRIVVPFGPGGLADVTSRVVGEKLGQRLGQQFLIDNKPGAGGATAAVAVLNAPADGYTLALLTNGTAVSKAFMTNLGFDPAADFVPVSTLGYFDFLIVTSVDHPYRTLGDLIAAAKARPGGLNAGTINIGSTQHLSAVLLNSLTGIDVNLIPYKTTPDAITAVIRKDVDFIVDGFSATGKLIADGRLRALASSGAARSAATPAVPTAIEQGLAGYDVTSWNAIFARKGTPDAVIARLNGAITVVLDDPEVKARLAGLGIEAKGSTPAEIGDKLATDVARWNGVIDSAKISRQ